MSTTDVQPTQRRRPSRRANPSPASRRGSRGQADGSSQLHELNLLVTQLIRENRQLRRQVDQLTKKTAGAPPAAFERTVRSLNRKLERELSAATTTTARRRRSTGATLPPLRPKRKITDPVLLEKRRQALAKARQVRAERRAAAT